MYELTGKVAIVTGAAAGLGTGYSSYIRKTGS